MNNPYQAMQPPEFLKLIAHDVRWRMVSALIQSDCRVNELVDLLGEKMNLISYHLKKLRDEEIVYTRRSDSDARDVYYTLNLDRIQSKFFESGALLHPALGCIPETELKRPETSMTAKNTVRVLFICTHNAARSQMAEGLMRHLGGERVEVYSAGSQPSELRPEAIETLANIGIDICSQQASSIDEYEGHSFDYVITVCDIAREACPTFPGEGQQIHWGYSDPLQIEDDVQRAEAFQEIAMNLITRIQFFLKQL